jgi:hypothetical protein
MSISMASPSLASAMTSALCASPSPSVRLFVVNEAGVDRETLGAAFRETDAIWARAGLRFIWAGPPETFTPRERHTVVVLIRRILVRSRASSTADAKKRNRTPLGWVPFGEDGRPANLIEISLQAITALVMRGEHINRPIHLLPAFGQRPLVGRGLGRVIAHEIGHWLVGGPHASDGLMRPRIGSPDLVTPIAPALPVEWVAAGAAQLLARSSHCGRDPQNQ